MTSTPDDPHGALRTRLASTPLPEPAPARVNRWKTTLAALPEPSRTRSPLPDPNRPDPARPQSPPAHPNRPDPARPQSPLAHPVRAGGNRGLGRPSSDRSTRRWPPASGLVAAAAAAIITVACLGSVADVLPGPATTGPAPDTETPLALTRVQLLSAVPTGRDFGPLSDPVLRSGCLAKLAGPTRQPEPLAGRQVLLDGVPGVLLVLPTAQPGTLRLLVVDPSCHSVLADATTGGTTRAPAGFRPPPSPAVDPPP